MATETPPSPATAAAAPTIPDRIRSLFTVPAPIKGFFSHFPLVRYPAEAIPWGSCAAELGADPRIFIFAQVPPPAGVGDTRPFTGRADLSYDPTCLMYQTLLRFRRVKHSTAGASTLASPNGALPFVIAPEPRRGPPGRPVMGARTIPATRIAEWAEGRSGKAPEGGQAAAADSLDAAFHSLIDHELRRAWLFSLFFTSNFDSVAAPLYLAGATRSDHLQRKLARSLRHAAQAELLHPPGSRSAVGPSADFLASIYSFTPTFSAWAGTSAGGARSTSIAAALSSAQSSILDGNSQVSLAGVGAVCVDELLREADEALGALADRIAASASGWLSQSDIPNELDAALFGYIHILHAPGLIEAGMSKVDQPQRPRWTFKTLQDIINRHQEIQRHWQRVIRGYYPDLAQVFAL